MRNKAGPEETRQGVSPPRLDGFPGEKPRVTQVSAPRQARTEPSEEKLPIVSCRVLLPCDTTAQSRWR